jgi:hypothetical protein
MSTQPNIKPKADFAYLDVAQALVINLSDSTGLIKYSNIDSKDITIGSKAIKYVPWGSTDDLPNQVLSKVGANPATSTGMEFNIQIAFGDGIVPVKREINPNNKEVKWVPYFDNREINQFFEDNDINAFMLEQMTDLKHFYNVFPEVILSRDKSPSARKIVELNHKEAVFSRLQEMNAKGVIENHLYNANFGTGKEIDPKETELTPLLDPKRPIIDLKRRLGLLPGLDGKTKVEDNYRYVMLNPFPTPGRFYYQMPYWYSIFSSGWYDYANSIPAFKNALMSNQMTIKYVVYIEQQYWIELFAAEGITDKKSQEERRKLEYEHIQEFLSGEKNSGKAIIAKFSYQGNLERKYIKIEPIENAFKGGDFIEDSEEASNILLFALGVHSSLIGSFPSKNGAISGTEARELFTIKQALMKPIRDRLLRPLYLVKAINKWPEEIHFAIPNMQLTTLDEHKDAKQVINQSTM